MTTRKGPVLIELDTPPELGPEVVPPVPELGVPAPQGHAMQVMATMAARRPSRLTRWFWTATLALLTFALSLAAWDFVTGLLAANPILGWIAAGLVGLVLLLLLLIGFKEAAAFARLGTLDHLKHDAQSALIAGDLPGARHVARRLAALYHARPELRLARETLDRQMPDVFDAAGILSLTEAELLAPLDALARREVEVAARQVATVTALVPIALADVFAALAANLRMIRRIAEIYGGRSGTLGAWRLTRAVLTHLVATGAVAVGDDLIGSVAGGSVLSKISRRFGEGVVNGALTARVGVAAMEVCRPLAFGEGRRPRVTSLVQRALTGLFGQKDKS